MQSEHYPLLTIGNKHNKHKGLLPSAVKPAHQRDALFPLSPYICYSYKEDPFDVDTEQYEVVVSHKARYRDANHFADVINAARNQMRPTDRPKGYTRSTEQTHEMEQRLSRLIDYSDIQQVSFLGISDNENISCGLHLNSSLVPIHDATPPIPIFEKDHKIMTAIESMSVDMMKFSCHLFAPNTQAVERWHARDSASFKQTKTHYPDDDYAYIENALFSADVNPHFAVMLQLAAIYEGLRAASASTPLTHHGRVRFTATDFANPSMREKHFTARDNPLRCTLNQLEPELGDRFVGAVLAHPQSRGMAEPTRGQWR